MRFVSDEMSEVANFTSIGYRTAYIFRD